ncbi:jacalin-like lectin domain protein [Heliobacillus mobilis]|uniref:Jacalin-like lectin domain protein n=1 Tax=Heliobacterium mobile TaxID=28064 RepID=A0A6I3SJI2_HELMO|nr:jacalin-like lectin [Heliobacterium mobile]MTV49013.1 jacalin-like lectin domain protein [Heliobacterium mobile]
MAFKKSPLFGGTGGGYFEDNLTEIVQLIKVDIYSGTYIDSIRYTFKDVYGNTRDITHGGGGGSLAANIILAEDEYINFVSIKFGNVIDHLELETNKGRHFYAGGTGGGKPVEFSGRISGFYGRAGSLIDAIGFFIPA